MSHSDNRRHGRVIDRNLQLGLAWRMMIVYFLFFLGGLVIMFAPSMYRLATGSNLNEIEPAAREFLILHHRVWPAALFIFGGVFLYNLLFSHRIAGPIHKINNVLGKMLEGEYPDKVALRRGDYFHATAELIEHLSRKTAQERRGEEPKEKNPPGPPST
jgi:hypothetical protein